ncbi:ABC transporter substrate-binding protein [Rathayibacter caricis DSM 15933]|uniref:ABC transporter substrate-binding protein n=1 Tax=Rathayibacter caricis DSM 15933 TaxID=1328867 RepID=A0A2T4UQ88_9MICO|nr:MULTISPECIES: extracellular solute-binding protein [Rathayibacter]KQQ20785.1 ABC transporter substrate-binding protein [Rathayibacter sp. Leaf299]MCJ1696757.1 extracellular solute-binding protein [Rathayibacter caricis]PTL71689.1 ABC transporter substrate-binding protein [Rathayibacter caricis DSM 15933]
MSTRQNRRAVLALGAGGAALALALTGCSTGGGDSADGSTLSILIDNTELAGAQMDALVTAYKEVNPDVTIEVETRPAGSEGDNVVKTRLATGEMADLFGYNSGSLFQALNPDQNLADLSDVEWKDSLTEDFQRVVSTESGFYGAPLGQSFGGAVLYNKDVYAELGLSVPTTWDEFLANSEAIKAAGDVAPIVQTYGDTWTSQLMVLGDFANVLAENPDWADEYTAGDAKYVDQPALAGFEHLQEAGEAGLFNEDFASATYDDGVRMVATGEGAQYPMLTFASQPLVANYPDAAQTVGTFPLPGESADSNPLTVWQPGAVYVSKTVEGEKLEAAKDFLAFLVSPESCDIQSEQTVVQGPYVIDGCDLPEDVPAMISDMQPYFDSGDTAPALEFLSPIKGPALEQITVAVGSGITSAAEGAQQYDDDVTKQAQQLGLEGW